MPEFDVPCSLWADQIGKDTLPLGRDVANLKRSEERQLSVRRTMSWRKHLDRQSWCVVWDGFFT